MKRTILAAVLLAGTALTAPASATEILTLGDNTQGPQSTVTGCIIAGTNCGSQNSFFGYNNFKQSGSEDDLNAFSTTPTAELPNGVQGNSYTAGQIALGVGGVKFNVGIDVNTAKNHENLSLFELVDVTLGTVLYRFTAPVGGDNLSVNANGNGFADYMLSSINLAGGFGVSATDQIYFHAVWDGLSDGAESFFLYNGSGGTVINPQCDPNCAPAVPGPVVGAGLPGLLAALGGMWGLNRYRRRRTA